MKSVFHGLNVLGRRVPPSVRGLIVCAVYMLRVSSTISASVQQGPYWS